MKKGKNTKKNYTIRFMLYPSGRGKFTAACLDLALIREGGDFQKLYKQINVLARKYIESIVKNNLSDGLLNQQLPKRYERKFEEIEKESKRVWEDFQTWRKWQKAFEALIWQTDKDKGNLLTTR